MRDCSTAVEDNGTVDTAEEKVGAGKMPRVNNFTRHGVIVDDTRSDVGYC